MRQPSSSIFAGMLSLCHRPTMITRPLLQALLFIYHMGKVLTLARHKYRMRSIPIVRQPSCTHAIEPILPEPKREAMSKP
jgi:hypothetical protein